jgi:multidrug efflux pump
MGVAQSPDRPVPDAVAGNRRYGLSYTKLGQSEDPPFTFKAMVIKYQLWPGATAEEVSRQVTERIEKKLMETGEYERIVSFSRPGESQVTFMARDSMHSAQIPDLWYQVRKKISDIRQTLPPDMPGAVFNDEFGTTFGNIYSLSGEGYDYAVLKDYADRIQIQLQRVKDVGKVELLGLQDEKIWIELSNLKLATLGLPLAAVQKALQEQNAVSTAGFFETPTERVQLRVSVISKRSKRSSVSRFASASALSASAMWPMCVADSMIHRRRACALWGRTQSAWPWP